MCSCEKETSSIIDSNLSVPILTSVTSSDAIINLDTTTSAAVVKLPNGTFKVSGAILARAYHSSGLQNIKLVVYRILEPRSSDYIASGSFTRFDTTYSATFSFIINRADIGLYKIDVYAQGYDNSVSNSLQVPLIITRNNSKPQTSNIVALDTITRPSTGFTLVQFTLTVNDSDGYSDIEQVFFKRISPSSSNMISLFDDGSQLISGDRFAGDGIFSRTVRIDSTALLGDQVFLFQAKDKAGILSDSLTHTITIIP